MPIRIECKLVGKSDIVVSGFAERGVLGFFSELFEKRSPALFDLLAVPQEPTPVTFGLFANAVKKKTQVAIQAEKPFRIIMTSMAPEYDNIFKTFIEQALNEKFALSVAGSEILILPLEETHGFIEQIGYEQMMMIIQPEEVIGIDFMSPTIFESPNGATIFPLPNLVFESLLSNWNLFSGHPVELDIPATIRKMNIRKFNLNTKTMDLGVFQRTGFTGQTAIEIKELDEETRKIFSLLSAYTWFAGVGSLRSMGLGQSKPLANESLKTEKSD